MGSRWIADARGGFFRRISIHIQAGMHYLYFIVASLPSKIDRESFHQAALDIAREVHQGALYARDGGIYWTQPSLRQEKPDPSKRLDSYLYPGSMGIALFFALAGKVLDTEAYGPLALHIVAPLRRDLREIALDPERAQKIQLPIGGFAGLGSLIYGMVRLGDLLGEPSLWDDALEISAFLSPERIAGAEAFDLMTGSAGALLALLALDARRPGANRAGHKPLDLALMAAEHLVRNRSSWIGRVSAPADQEEHTPSIGFCHGAAGIACALARLSQEVDRADIGQAVQEGWAYIDATYDPDIENWRLPARGGLAGSSWCNGAAGLLLGRIERMLADAAFPDSSLTGAIRILRETPLSEHDHLCCGNMGRVDALLHAAHRLKDPRILESAESLAMKVLSRARQEGGYRLMFYPEDLIDLRLFPGLTGVGYAFLRILAPETTPCWLALA